MVFPCRSSSKSVPSMMLRSDSVVVCTGTSVAASEFVEDPNEAFLSSRITIVLKESIVCTQ